MCKMGTEEELLVGGGNGYGLRFNLEIGWSQHCVKIVKNKHFIYFVLFRTLLIMNLLLDILKSHSLYLYYMFIISRQKRSELCK